MIKLFNSDEIRKALVEFQTPDDDLSNAGVWKAESLTPDSEAVLAASYKDDIERLYVLYIEDYIDSLEKVKERIQAWCGYDVIEFMNPVKTVSNFDDTQGSRYYKNKDETKIKNWVRYTVPSGHDYMFLALVSKVEMIVTR